MRPKVNSEKKRYVPMLLLLVLLALVAAVAYFGCIRTVTGPLQTGDSPASEETLQIKQAPQYKQDPVFIGCSTLTPEILGEFVDALGNAYDQKDISFLSGHIATEAQIHLEQNGRAFDVDKKEYLDALQLAWSKVESYRYQQGAPTIAVQNDRANVHLTVEETGEMMGIRIRTEVDTTLELALQQGRIAVIALRGTSHMSMEK